MMRSFVIMVTILMLLAPVGAGDPFKVVTDVPTYVRPGDTFTVSVVVTNDTDMDQSNVKVRLDVPSPFDIVGEKEVELGKLDYEFFTTKAALFKLHVRESASYGIYTIPFTVTSSAQTYSDKLVLKVIGTTLLNISSISVDKEKIFPGDIVTIAASVENKGANALKWVKVSLNSNPFQNPNPSLVPLASTEAVFLNMKSGASRQTSFAIAVGNDVVPANYPLRFTISYQDEADAQGSYDLPYGVEVLGRASIVFSSIEPDPSEPTQNDTVVLNVSLKNVGDIQAKSVKGLAAFAGGRYSAFLPDIAKDESGSLAFNIGTLESGTYDFAISVSWVDEYGQEGDLGESFVLTVKKEEKTYTPLVAGGVLVLVLVGAYFLKKRSK